jgi:DNA ligase-1
MKRFTRLYTELDQTTRTNEKVLALESYFREAPPADAAWALSFLCGRRPARVVAVATLRNWAADEADLPSWMIDECHEVVGDLAETLALLLPAAASTMALPLHEAVEQRLLPMRQHPDGGRELLLETWRELDPREKLVWNKLITGEFRVGVAQTLVVRALARVAGIDQAVMAHRLMGKWQPTSGEFLRLLEEGGPASDEPARPYPFFLASPLEGDPSALGDLAEWQAEWKWDGIRGQLIRRQGESVLWSRGDELVTDTFPEIAEAGRALLDGTVLDGEIIAWRDEMPQPFGQLQRRLGRKTVSPKLRAEFPVIFLAFDLLERNGEDWRGRPLEVRRHELESVVDEAERRRPEMAGLFRDVVWETPDLFEPSIPSSAPAPALAASALLAPATWEELACLQQESRERHVEGIILKRKSSAYGVGRQRGDWWKWKIDPLVIDAVLINAQLGHGRRATLYTDYTFGLWHDGTLVPVAKAYSGLSDEEILEVDGFVRANTTGRFGPIRAVKPALVFELAFEAVQKSSRHKAGIAVRFPRMNRWRRDKQPEEADTLASLSALLRETPRP